jgi:hypothetical protein
MNKNYTGKSGQLAVMAEFLIRGYNVAMPEVDEGDDIFVVHHHAGTLWRIQVKTANARRERGGLTARFNVTAAQLNQERTPDLMFVFAVRHAERWADFIVIPREALQDLQARFAIGKVIAGNVMFELVFSRGTVRCRQQSFRRFRNAWTAWPTLVHA